MLSGHKLLASLLAKKDVTAFYNAKLNPSYFNADATIIYNFITDHLIKHGALPDVSTVKELYGELPETPEPSSYYLAKVEERYGFSVYNTALSASATLLKDKNIEGLIKVQTDAISKIKSSAMRHSVMDFGVESAQLFKTTHAASFYGNNGIKMGWETIDSLTEGMVGGDIVSIIGRPASGKTFFNLWVAYSAYLAQKRNVLFLTMEMSIPAINQRMVGIVTRANMTDLKKGQLSSDKHNEIVTTLTGLSGFENKLWIADGSLKATVEDVAALILQYKPDLVVVDGAYLLKHSNPRLDRFTRVAENVEALKQLAEVHKIPMLLSYQFSREASKKKSKGEEVGLEDIAYSDAIGQISSVVLGLMQPETSETLNERVITVLKGRNGEYCKFNIKWDFTNVDFSEVPSLMSESTDHHDGQYDSDQGFVD